MKALKLMTALLLLLLGYRSFGQPLEIGLMGGLSLYSGDLSEQEFGFYPKDAEPAYGFFVRLPLNDWLGARLNLNAGKLKSEDFDPERGLNFRSQITEVNLIAEIALFRTGSESSFSFSPKLMVGAGLFRFNPEGFLDGEWIELQPLGTEGQGLPGYAAPYRLTQFNIPAGLQLEFSMSNRVRLGLEVGGRKLFTDHLDDISGGLFVYRDILEGNGPLAARFSNPNIDPEGNIDDDYQRGGFFNDWYWISGVTIAVVLGNWGGGSRRGSGCYEF